MSTQWCETYQPFITKGTLTELRCHVVQADVMGRSRVIGVASEEPVAKQTQTLLLPAQLLRILAKFGFLRGRLEKTAISKK